MFMLIGHLSILCYIVATKNTKLENNKTNKWGFE